MSILTRTSALTATAVMLAVPAAVLVSSPAQADVERRGPCGAGFYEFNVDREANGFEIDAELENVPVGSKWKIVLRHDGHRFAKVVRSADYEGDLDVDRYRANTAGKDVFTMRAKRVGGTASCSSTITLR